MSLAVDVPETQAPDVAANLRDALELTSASDSVPVQTHLLGQGAPWPASRASRSPTSRAPRRPGGRSWR
jgi:hypothetical protein